MRIYEITRTTTDEPTDTDLAIETPPQGNAPAKSEKRSVKSKSKKKRSIRARPDVALGGLNPGLDQDDLSDAEALANAQDGPTWGLAEPVPPNPENLPARISREIGSPEAPEIDWIKVRHLPTYVVSMIRRVARDIFSQFTTFPIEEMDFISTATNPEDDVKRVMKWVMQNGIKDNEAEIDLDNVVRGLGVAEVKHYRTKDLEFLLVKDVGGYYAYKWPGGRGVHVGQNRSRMLQ